ncbi:histidine phosphatase family protein [Patescibacteria group bacterium]|nr:histidine phosphatase family protein [Patescibacteria group bacterium]
MIKLKPALEIYFVRNAETKGNQNFQLQGQTEGSLSDKGVAQAKLLGKPLKTLGITKVYCSPLLRARDTFKHSGLKLKPIFLDELKERNFGDLTNLTYFEMINLPYDFRPENGESLLDMKKRAAGLLNKIVKENKIGDKVAVFTHHEVTLSSVAYVIGLPLENFRKLMIANASITQIDYYDDKFTLKRISDQSYLAKLQQTVRSY